MSEQSQRFHNVFRILYSLDLDELKKAGVFRTVQIPLAEWERWNSNPLRFILCLDEVQFARLWELIESRQPPPSPAPKERAMVERQYPDKITPELKEVLSLMLWKTGEIAHILRAGGIDIPRKAEEEQCAVLHWLITLAIDYGDDWKQKFGDRMDAIMVKAKGGEAS